MAETKNTRKYKTIAESVEKADADILELMRKYRIDVDDNQELLSELHRNTIRLVTIARMKCLEYNNLLDYYRTCDTEDLIAIRGYLYEDLKNPRPDKHDIEACKALISMIDGIVGD